MKDNLLATPLIRKGFLICAVVASVLFATACVSTSATKLGSQTYPPTTAESIVVFRTAESVGRPFTEIGLIKAAGDDELTDEAQMLEEMKKEAAKLGANGIILGQIKDASSEDKLVGELLETSAERKGEVVAIRFNE